MIYNMEKVDRVIDKIIRDLGLGQDLIPYADFIEWIADGLQHIGAYYQYQEKETGIVIQNYTGLLPCDLHKVVRITEGTSITPSTDGGLYGGTLSGLLAKLGVDFTELSQYERNMLNTAGLGQISASNYTEVVNRLQHNKNLIGNPQMNAFTNKDYNINLNRITTAYSDGVINIQYLALPIDERGWPLVPDDVSFRDALFWKCAYHLSMRNPSALPNQRMQDLEYNKQKWNFYCMQARASANMPDLAMTERLANNWIRLFNTVDDSTDYYRKVGKVQNLNLNGRD